MTPTGIRTGRTFAAYGSATSVNAAATTQIAPGASDRVSLTVALPAATTAALDGTVAIGYLVGTAFVALTCLSAGHPVCFLSVDKMGNAIFPAIFARNGTTGALVMSVTDVRQTQELP